MIIRDLSLTTKDGVATLTIAVGKSAVMAIDLNGPVTTEGWINVPSADLADALHSVAEALPKLVPTL